MQPTNRGGLDVLLLAAHPLELEPFTPALAGPDQRSEIAGVTIAAASVGVGAFVAGAGSALALARHAPRAAVLVGSYGLYPGHGSFEPGQLLIAGRVCAADAAALTGRAAFPQPMASALAPDPALTRALIAAHPGVVRSGALATTLAITTDDALAEELARGSACEGENLEALPVGLACQAAGIPYAVVVGCSNAVGSRGRAQWLMHRAQAARATAEHVLGWLAAGAPGLPPRP